MSLASIQRGYAFVLNQKAFWSSLVWAIPLLAIGLASPLLMKPHLMRVTEGLAQCPDLLLDNLPTINTIGIAAWGPLFIAILFTIHLLLKPWYIPIAAKSVGILFLLRGFFIILTPLGFHPDQYIKTVDTFWQSISYYGNDYFFSGHVAFPFLLSLIFWKQKTMRVIYLLSAFVMGTSVILEHIHYSIDVFAAPFIVYGVWNLCVRFFRNDLSLIAEASRRGLEH